MPDRDDLSAFETRDRSFLPALEAQEARERGHSTDPNWRSNAGGLSEPTPLSWPSPTAGTITPPSEPLSQRRPFTTPIFKFPMARAETMSPFLRAELERIARDLDAARAELRRLLEQPT